MDLTPELLLSWTRQGPRYTSYPTVPEWRDTLPDTAWTDAIAAIRRPASVYVHVPFCREQCTFCGCTMVVAGRREPGRKYLDSIARQLDQLRFADNAEKLDVVRIHFGGGTPTWFSPEELTELYTMLYRRFRPLAGAELSVEVDPEVTSDEHVDALAACGTTRLSIGVQSFDPVVLAAVNRPQASSEVERVFARARHHGMTGLNLDLMYGLPHQTPERFAGTLARTLALRPDRLALFGYAHVPWLKGHQKRLDVSALPDPVARAGLFLQAHAALVRAGYDAIGMDHFALTDDALSIARREGRLHRNFMGYTTHADLPLIGLGMSAISEFPNLYTQQKSKLSHWWKAIAGEDTLLERACVVSEDDRMWRDAINGLMCNLQVDLAAIAADYQRPAEVFDEALQRLDGVRADGLVLQTGYHLQVPDEMALLVRNVAIALDPRMAKPSTGGPRYSATV